MGNLAGALVYKGTISATNGLPSNASTGWTYVASTSFVYNDGSNDWAVESGDMFIYNGTKWNIVSGENQIENNVDAIILGAFGCGAFHNPPKVVAKAFKTVLLEKRYSNAFYNVIFAVKRSGIYCENINVFEMIFKEFVPSGESY